MNGTPSPAHISFKRPAVSNASSRDSITHGPAMRNSGRSRPTSNPQSFIGRVLCRRGCGTALVRLVGERRLDERLEQRVAAARRGRELGMKLAADEPRMTGQLDHLA